ncbi:SAV_6107 family HEPN domain-containing protein [Streptomyces yaizuensis]|uniref:SAV_6107 family HEPN domain-containing protein n=1 Tax=Streptomyces yaizuensis TaxID=2989713 RepID=A0ABQ5NV06_9ACTN|nr:SAV_6107 family HEPN domain-containing protein [Streptomyces sp. YSPA8]GLF94172.1 SAV_6107 family HEPN domain-containing protein [Streptomyces sp. YSPA8]
MASKNTAAAHRRRAPGPVPSLNGPASDVHPVQGRASAPPAALDLLAQARAGLDEAAGLSTPNERYATAHLAAIRTAAAVLAARGYPDAPTTPRRAGPAPARRGRRAAIRSVWELLPESAPELDEWSAHFAAGAQRRARAQAGIAGAATGRDAGDLLRDVAMFLRLVERMLLPGPELPRPREARREPEDAV